ncbi:mycofactocin precursor MftA [Nocardioides sp. cx-173]|nr:mycofactocin precursor MftA [Nocardioides sp. cx-173]MCD4523580.1 mycofactocin precursor MftA [Nocardioides sp. cx-173]UGB42084.1 mycofactocin precursor MftA [Nocardioides sp. cx-173]
MTEPTQTQTSAVADASTDQDLVTEDLIEEVSIDGMCGVY